MNAYLFCKKRGVKLNVLICEARGCSHLKEKDDRKICKFSPLMERLARKRKRKKGGKNDRRNDS